MPTIFDSLPAPHVFDRISPYGILDEIDFRPDDELSELQPQLISIINDHATVTGPVYGSEGVLEVIQADPSCADAFAYCFYVSRPVFVSGQEPVWHSAVESIPLALAFDVGKLQAVERTVCRVRWQAGGESVWATAVAITSTTLLTNAHVARKLQGEQAVVDYEGDAYPVQTMRIARPGQSDLALLRVATPLQVEPAPWAHDPSGPYVCAIGYPCQPPFAPGNFLNSMFSEESYQNRTLSPGHCQVQKLANRITHTCSTTFGNSGGPVVRLTDGAIVGLHYDRKKYADKTVNQAVSTRGVVNWLALDESSPKLALG